MCNKNDPMVKSLERHYKKDWLMQLANEAGLSTKGTKNDLAVRVAAHNYERFSREWEAISNG